MIVTMHMCMPQGETMRQQFTRLYNEVKDDNRRVIAAMMAAGQHVPDTVGELGLSYVPEHHRTDSNGEPMMDIYGLRAMIDRGSFSCGEAAAYEAAVMNEKYRVPARCLAVAQGIEDLHAVYVTPEFTVDPTANFLAGRAFTRPRAVANPTGACNIVDGRVICDEPPDCCVDEHGVWSCPAVPGLSSRRERIGRIFSREGARWAKLPSGAVVPICARSRR